MNWDNNVYYNIKHRKEPAIRERLYFFYLTDQKTKIIVKFSHLSRKLPPVLLMRLCILTGILCSGFLPLFAFSTMIFCLTTTKCPLLSSSFPHLPHSPQKPKRKSSWIPTASPCRPKAAQFHLPHEIQVSFFTWMYPLLKVLCASMKFCLLLC